MHVIWKLSKIVTHYQENSDPSVFIRKAITLPGTIGTEDTAITSQGLEDDTAGPAAMKNQSVVLRMFSSEEYPHFGQVSSAVVLNNEAGVSFRIIVTPQ